ncbi:outer membrane lipoprotein carrier protein LolA [Tropicimonas sp. IMCC34011]|uniref:LolA family protein n=1 Tax=Tropicimonas sp. IMCC34011 TaxID=2248759 RepID=UPI000E233A5E|nr:outer membrane lipoprotein carrier protein LolA [Tropicimonas sp. IMCC34011]
MNRRMLITAAFAAAVAVGSAVPAAAKASLGELSSYLNSIQSATGEFTQVNPDGTISTGQIYIKRPGRVRFEYAPPTPSLVMAGGGQVAVFDPKSNQPPEQYPLSQTPLNLILAQNVDLNRANMVRSHTSDATTTTVLAQDPQRPEYGTIELKFTDSPVELRQWIITDSSGAKTTVILGGLKKVGDLRPSLFNIVQEAQKRGFRG